MIRSWKGAALLLAIAAGALLLRGRQLDRRPMHHDEANQALRFESLLESGQYRYSPTEYHGPTLYYLTLPVAWLQAGREFANTTESTFRIVPVLFGVGLILLLFLLRDGLGWPTVLCSALLTALSPAMVYYSRFFAQEMLLVFFSFGAIACGWWYVRTRRYDWAVFTGVFIGLMYATKETCVITYAAMAAGILVVYLTHHHEEWPFHLRHMLLATAVAGGVSLVMLCSFFTNPQGPLDSLRSFTIYLNRAGEGGLHNQPWYFYLRLLIWFREGRGPIWSEGLILGLAVAGAVAAWVRKETPGIDQRLLRFLTVYAVVLTAVYSYISYKTPWCLLSFLHPMILLAGFGAFAILDAIKNRTAKACACMLLVVGTWNLGRQAWRANFTFPADPRNPYVYAQTAPDFLNLVNRIEQIAAVSPAQRDTLIRVVADAYSTWPLPWYLRKFSKVGYWQTAAELSGAADAPIVIASAAQQDAIAEGLKGDYQTEYYGLRPDVLLTIFIRRDLWQEFLKTREHRTSKNN